MFQDFALGMLSQHLLKLGHSILHMSFNFIAVDA